MESALYCVYTLVVLYQKSHSFASLTCSISDTPQLVCKHRTRALSMKYSIFTVTLGGSEWPFMWTGERFFEENVLKEPSKNSLVFGNAVT